MEASHRRIKYFHKVMDESVFLSKIAEEALS